MDEVPVTPNSPSPAAGAPSESFSSAANTTAEASSPFVMPPANEDFIVQVCDPVVQDPNSMRAYVTYAVKSKMHCSNEDYCDGEYDVIRRYSDYVWLHERLALEFPHLNVPPLPAKASMGNLEERFINMRQAMLNKFMNRITRSHAMLLSPGLKVFLTEKFGAEFDHAKKALPAPHEFKVEEKKVGLFAKLKSKVTTKIPKELEVPACADQYQYTLTYATKLAKMVPATEKYIAKRGELAKGTGDMGVAMQEYAAQVKELDPKNAALGDAFDALGDSLQTVAELQTQNMYEEETILVSNVGENIMLLKGVERVFNARKAACATYCGVKDGKLIGMDEGEAEKHFKGIDDSLQPECESANACVEEDMKMMLVMLTEARKTQLRKELEAWEALENKLEGMDL